MAFGANARPPADRPSHRRARHPSNPSPARGSAHSPSPAACFCRSSRVSRSTTSGFTFVHPKERRTASSDQSGVTSATTVADGATHPRSMSSQSRRFAGSPSGATSYQYGAEYGSSQCDFRSSGSIHTCSARSGYAW